MSRGSSLHEKGMNFKQHEVSCDADRKLAERKRGRIASELPMDVGQVVVMGS